MEMMLRPKPPEPFFNLIETGSCSTNDWLPVMARARADCEFDARSPGGGETTEGEPAATARTAVDDAEAETGSAGATGECDSEDCTSGEGARLESALISAAEPEEYGGSWERGARKPIEPPLCWAALTEVSFGLPGFRVPTRR